MDTPEGKNFRISTGEDSARVSPEGELDMYNCEPLRQAIMEQIGAKHIKVIEIDFGGVAAIDASFVGLLYAVHNKASNGFATDVRLTNLDSSYVQKVFDNTKVQRLFPPQ